MITKSDMLKIKIEEEKIIAIVRGVDKKDILNFAKAVYEGGIRLLEVTYNASDPSTDEETAAKTGSSCCCSG